MASARPVLADLAYLTWRPVAPDGDGAKRWEVGIIGNGPAGRDLAQQMAIEVSTWDATHRTCIVRFEIPDIPGFSDPAISRLILHRPHHPLAVIWD